MSYSVLDLATRPWKLSCYRISSWMLRSGLDVSNQAAPEFTVEAKVPGSAHTALRAANIPDWNAGTNSCNCEWLENRQFEFSTELDPIAANTPVTLEADGLDYS